MKIQDLGCPSSKVNITDDFTYTFMHTYKGFSNLLGCYISHCLNSIEEIAEANETIAETIYEYEKDIDALITKFYLYSDIYIGKLFKHYKKGTIYQLILISNLESTDQIKFPTTAVYKDVETEIVWSRPLEEFINNFKIQGH
jgi:hypothetical protein